MNVGEWIRYAFDSDYRQAKHRKDDTILQDTLSRAQALQSQEAARALQAQQAEQRLKELGVQGAQRDREIGLQGGEQRKTYGYERELSEPDRKSASEQARSKLRLDLLQGLGMQRTPNRSVAAIDPELAATLPDNITNANAQAQLLNATRERGEGEPRRNPVDDAIAKEVGTTEYKRYTPEGYQDFLKSRRATRQGDNAPFVLNDGQRDPREGDATAFLESVLAGAQGDGGARFRPREDLIRSVLADLPGEEDDADPKRPGSGDPKRLTITEAIDRLLSMPNLDLGDLGNRLRGERKLTRRVTPEDIRRLDQKRRETMGGQ